jgi:hypothetical protein
MRFRLVGLLAMLAVIVASCGGGVVTEGADPSVGIQVHGDWTIDVYNPEGSLDRHVEFSNGLYANGAELLASAMAGQTTVGVWGVTLDGPEDLCPSSPNGDCWIPMTSGFVSLEDVSGDEAKETLRLASSTAVEVDGTISAVSTNIGTCTADTAPDDCFLVDRSNGFTVKDVTTLDWDGDGTPNDGAIPISAGQDVQVQVDISFTSG